jgi:hypothetical protein
MGIDPRAERQHHRHERRHAKQRGLCPHAQHHRQRRKRDEINEKRQSMRGKRDDGPQVIADRRDEQRRHVC